MARFKLQPEPTFRKKVALPVPGEADAPVEFVFKYRDRAEMKTFLDAMQEMKSADAIMEMCSGWDLADAFTRDAVETLVRTCIQAPPLITEAYLDELTQVRRKN